MPGANWVPGIPQAREHDMKMLLSVFAALLVLASFAPAQAASPEFDAAILGLAAQDRDIIIQSVETLGKLGDGAALPALQALLDDTMRVSKDGRPIILDKDGKAHDALTNEPFKESVDDLESPSISNQVRRSLEPVVAQLSLVALDPAVRLKAVETLLESVDPDMAPAIEIALAKEKDSKVAKKLTLALALINLDSPDKAKKISAIRALGEAGDQEQIAKIQAFTAKNEDGSYAEPDADIRKAAEAAGKILERKAAFVRSGRDLFYGVSLGSVMLLAALGLAITFGLMGVINMAHGEMIMLGAYSTYVVQELFTRYLPSMADWYLPFALPLAFLVPCCVGVLLERAIIRHLYGRPLETLLATWGISLGLIQTVRLIFGAQNVEVHNPSWLSGGIEPVTGLIFTYNRVAIIAFALLVVGVVWYLLQRTPLGLKVRAVTQSRSIASAMGIYTSKIDMWTFGLGSGIAGLGGLALTQVGNVNPELGQGYIVDSFMVVVLGGVGKLAGTVVGSFGLGIVNKILEPFAGAVLGKIILLGVIVLFIQKRPQGIFAVKGRMAEN